MRLCAQTAADSRADTRREFSAQERHYLTQVEGGTINNLNVVFFGSKLVTMRFSFKLARWMHLWFGNGC